MFVLTYEPAEPGEEDSLEEEFESEAEARARGCDLLINGEAIRASVVDETGATVVGVDELRSHYENQRSGSGSGFRVPARRGTQRVNVLVHVVGSGAGQWVIVRVKDSATYGEQAERMLRALQMAFKKPVCLMGDRRSYGPPNLTSQLKRADPRRMGWDRYTVTLPS